MDAALQDLRFALRQIRRRPLFAAVAALSLALGVGANTAIFSAVSALLLRPVPGVETPDRVVEIGRTRPDGSGFDSWAYPDFRDVRDQAPALANAAAFTFETFSLSRGGEGERVTGMHVSPSYFGVMGVVPERGRFFLPDEDRPGSRPAVAIVSHRFWTEALGGNPDVVGSSVRINRVPLEIVGVAPADFTGHTVGFQPDVYLPLQATVTLGRRSEELFDSRGSSWHQAVARLAPGATVAEADAQVQAVYARLAEAYPETNAQRSGRAVALGLVPGGGRGPVTAFLSVLVGMVVLILLVTCANVAGMFVARATAREREIAVRLSLGAGRGRLVRQLLTESLLIFLLGGVGGALLGAWAAGAVSLDRLPIPLPVRLDLSPDPGVLLLALGVTLVTGLLFGLLPALQATRVELVSSLKDDGSSRRAGAGLLRRFFVAAQVGLSLVLLASAGLLLRALQRASDVDPGFEAAGAYLSGVDLGMEGFGAEDGSVRQTELLDALAALPGVSSAALAVDLPLDLSSNGTGAYPEGWTDRDGREGLGVDFNVVSADYFRTLGIDVAQGRGFTPDDRAGSEPVAVVSRAFVDRVWPGESVLGRRVRVAISGVSEEWRTVVGVVPDVKNQMLTDDPAPFVYVPLAQSYASATHVVVRARGGMATVAPMLRAGILAVDGSLSLAPVVSLEGYTALGILPQRVAAALTTSLGLLALLLSGLGIYGVVAFSVAQRTREIGVRMALGAGRASVLRLVLDGGLRLALPGLVVGSALAVGAGWALRFLLLGLSPLDPVALGGVAAALLAVVALASLVPGRRAAAITPVEALRSE